MGISYAFGERLLIAADISWFRWSKYTSISRGDPKPIFHGSIIPRFGLEYRPLVWLDLRLGYFYDASPVPDQSDVTSNYLDMDKNVMSFGMGYGFIQIPFIGRLPIHYPIQIDAFFQYQFMKTRVQLKDWETTQQESWYVQGRSFALGIGLTLGF